MQVYGYGMRYGLSFRKWNNGLDITYDLNPVFEEEPEIKSKQLCGFLENVISDVQKTETDAVDNYNSGSIMYHITMRTDTEAETAKAWLEHRLERAMDGVSMRSGRRPLRAAAWVFGSILALGTIVGIGLGHSEIALYFGGLVAPLSALSFYFFDKGLFYRDDKDRVYYRERDVDKAYGLKNLFKRIEIKTVQ